MDAEHLKATRGRARRRVRTLDEDIVEDATMRGAATDDGAAAVGPSES